MKQKSRIHKFQRQKFEYTRQTGRKLIDEEYTRLRSVINKKNKEQINQMFLSNVKGIKRKYNVTNIGKAERCWTQFYNKIDN